MHASAMHTRINVLRTAVTLFFSSLAVLPRVCVCARSCSLQDGIERQLTPPTPPPRRNPPSSTGTPSTGTAANTPVAAAAATAAATATAATAAAGTTSGSSVATTTITASCTTSANTSTTATSSSPASSSNGTNCYYTHASRGCCVDCAWSNHGTGTPV